MLYSKIFYCKNSRRYSEKKTENIVRLFFIFWIRSNIFCNFSGCRRSILISEKIIRIDCPLAFQCRIQKYSTAKTRKDMTQKKTESRKWLLGFSSLFWICSNIFRNFSGCRRLKVENDGKGGMMSNNDSTRSSLIFIEV